VISEASGSNTSDQARELVHSHLANIDPGYKLEIDVMTTVKGLDAEEDYIKIYRKGYALNLLHCQTKFLAQIESSSFSILPNFFRIVKVLGKFMELASDFDEVYLDYLEDLLSFEESCKNCIKEHEFIPVCTLIDLLLGSDDVKVLRSAVRIRRNFMQYAGPAELFYSKVICPGIKIQRNSSYMLDGAKEYLKHDIWSGNLSVKHLMETFSIPDLISDDDLKSRYPFIASSISLIQVLVKVYRREYLKRWKNFISYVAESVKIGKITAKYEMKEINSQSENEKSDNDLQKIEYLNQFLNRLDLLDIQIGFLD